jgi:hypothetical protein
MRVLIGVSLGIAAALVAAERCVHEPRPAPLDVVTGSDPSGDLRAAPAAGKTSVADVDVRCDAPTHPISAMIYGIGARPMHDEPDPWQLGATIRRWGGNHTSRYNWEIGNAFNAGHDWFFRNLSYGYGGDAPAYERFVADDVAHGLDTAITVPILGWAARDTTSYAFPVAVYGRQHGTAPENSDIGDGVGADGTPIEGSPERTSVAMPPQSIGRWVRAIREADPSRRRRGVVMYILDNEPTLWSETHRDVHPRPLGYDELLERTIDYATEVRRADPGALIAGPASWGWTGYFESGVDVASHPARVDRARHGGVPLLPWWLRQIAAHEKATGVPLIDVLDVHFYPQGEHIGVGTEGDTDADTAARRIRATRSLWDPTYVDESWIREPVKLLPRLREWIDREHPGLGISIGEYNFGAEGHMSGGLAVAEALGRFGQAGITSAFYWDYPPAGSPAYWAFRAYRNFDGAGGHFLDQSVATVSDVPLVSAFASRDGDRMVLVLLDLDPSADVAARVHVGTCGDVVRARAFVGKGDAAGLVPGTPPDPSTPEVRLTLPAYSIVVLDLQLGQEAGHKRG